MSELNLEEKIAAWRKEVSTADSIDKNALRELESHLRDAIDAEIRNGATEAGAFTLASVQLGDAASLEPEFNKVYGQYSWAKRLLWMVAGYALVNLAYLLIQMGQLAVENLTLRLFPGQMVGLLRPVELNEIGDGLIAYQAHISVFTGIAFSIAATILSIWLAARCIRDRSILFNRFFANCFPCRLVLLVGLLPVLYVLTVIGVSFISFDPSLNTLSDTARYGMPRLEYTYLRRHFGTAIYLWRVPIEIGFAIWAVTTIRKDPKQPFIGWIFAGFFVVKCVSLLASVLGLLIGFGLAGFDPDFAMRDLRPLGSTFPLWSTSINLFSLLIQMLILGCLALLALRLAVIGRSIKIERWLSWLSRHAIPIILFSQLPVISTWFISIFKLGSPLSMIFGDRLMESVSISIRFHPAFLAPWTALAIACAAAWVLFDHGGSKDSKAEMLAD